MLLPTARQSIHEIIDIHRQIISDRELNFSKIRELIIRSKIFDYKNERIKIGCIDRLRSLVERRQIRVNVIMLPALLQVLRSRTHPLTHTPCLSNPLYRPFRNQLLYF